MQFLGGGRGGMRAWGGKSAPGPFPREGDTAKPPPRFVRAVRMLTKSTDCRALRKPASKEILPAAKFVAEGDWI